MKKIPLTQGKYALVSDCDYRYLMQWKWYYAKKGYAVRNGPRPEYKCIFMADVVAARKGIVGKIDHKNRKGLDNQRGNLRPATNSLNQGNAWWSTNRSGYKGVSFDRRDNSWRAKIEIDGRHKNLGSFSPTEAGKVEAAYAYTVAADWRFKEFAYYKPVAHLLDAKTKRRIKRDVLARLESLAA